MSKILISFLTIIILIGSAYAFGYGNTISEFGYNIKQIIFLNDLKDVNAPSPSAGQVLEWDGNNWVPATDDTGGGGSTGAGYLYNASTTMYLNGTLLNTTIDQRASGQGGNLSWNESYADTLYSDIKWGYNQTYSGSTYNATYDSHLSSYSNIALINQTNIFAENQNFSKNVSVGSSNFTIETNATDIIIWFS